MLLHLLCLEELLQGLLLLVLVHVLLKLLLALPKLLPNLPQLLLLQSWYCFPLLLLLPLSLLLHLLLDCP